MQLQLLDIIIFAGYFIGIIVFAVVVAARSRSRDAASYFLASNQLPWYAVGASFIAANISTEHFIGMVGWSFLYGMSIANWCWLNAVTFSALIWIFLPFYMRGAIATMPEFLERRFNRFCRYAYALLTVIGLVIALLGGVFFAGAKAITVFFPEVSTTAAIIILAIAAGTYTIYGGLLSAVWADLLQYILLMTGGLVAAIYGLYYAGGLDELMQHLPEKFIILYPSTHEMIPWTGLLMGIPSVGLWYSCANQFMVQRCLGARSEWDARMGVVMAGFSQAILPLLIVIPGIAAFYLFHDQLSDGDQSWPFMVRQFLPAGLVGLVLAGLTSAVMSTLSAITNSSATIFTLDLYKNIVRPHADDREIHRVGRISGAAAMFIGVIVAFVMARAEGATVFGLIQTVFYYLAPPIAAVFLVGIIWWRATPAAATAALTLGFAVYLPLVVFVIFPRIPLLAPYDNFMHHTFGVFLLSVLTIIIVSLFTKPKPREALKGVIWTRSALAVPEGERKRHTGIRSLGLWWTIMVVLTIGLYAYTYSVGSNSEALEAERLAYTTSSGTAPRVQRKTELKNFNLWTGDGQVLFEPQRDGERLTFTLPITEPGRYQLDALVTKGPAYGQYDIEVQGQPAEIQYNITERSGAGHYSVRHLAASTFDARHPAAAAPSGGSASQIESIAGEHVVQRISLGSFAFDNPDNATVSFVARHVEPGHALIGVDLIALTRTGDLPDPTKE